LADKPGTLHTALLRNPSRPLPSKARLDQSFEQISKIDTIFNKNESFSVEVFGFSIFKFSDFRDSFRTFEPAKVRFDAKLGLVVKVTPEQKIFGHNRLPEMCHIGRLVTSRHVL
jgi:hypothetical protein